VVSGYIVKRYYTHR